MSNSAAIIQLQAKQPDSGNYTSIDTLLSAQLDNTNLLNYNYKPIHDISTYYKKIQPKESVNFSRRATFDIDKDGHMMAKMYLVINLPALTPSSGTYASWSDTLGYAIFDGSIDLKFDNIIVARLFPDKLNDILDELSTTTKRVGNNLMILKSDIYRANNYNATQSNELIIPLNFWFSGNAGSTEERLKMALPLMNMKNYDISIEFKLKPFASLVNYDGTDPPTTVDVTNCHLYVEYFYLTDTLYNEYREKEITYVIENYAEHGVTSIPANSTSCRIEPNITTVTKEIFLVAVDQTNEQDNNVYFDYLRRSDDTTLITDIKVYLDSRERFPNMGESFYRRIVPHLYHSVVPDKPIYCIPFSVSPEKQEPSGSINLKYFPGFYIQLGLRPGNPELKVYMYSIYYNVLVMPKENGDIKFKTFGT